VYSPCARLTIQKLLVERDDPRLADLIWVPGVGWTEPSDDYELINPSIFNCAAHEGGDGPGYFSAEINVKGRIIYGYTWNVRKLNDSTVNFDGEAAGDYRVTFSFDQTCGTYEGSDVDLNTFFVDGVTEIMLPLEEEEAASSIPVLLEGDEENNETGGGVGVLKYEENLTYMDVRILERSGGEKK